MNRNYAYFFVRPVRNVFCVCCRVWQFLYVCYERRKAEHHCPRVQAGPSFIPQLLVRVSLYENNLVHMDSHSMHTCPDGSSVWMHNGIYWHGPQNTPRHGFCWVPSAPGVSSGWPRRWRQGFLRARLRLELADAALLKVSSPGSTSVAWLTQQGQLRVRDGAGTTIERRSLSGTPELLCSTQQEPVPTY